MLQRELDNADLFLNDSLRVFKPNEVLPPVRRSLLGSLEQQKIMIARRRKVEEAQAKNEERQARFRLNK